MHIQIILDIHENIDMTDISEKYVKLCNQLEINRNRCKMLNSILYLNKYDGTYDMAWIDFLSLLMILIEIHYININDASICNNIYIDTHNKSIKTFMKVYINAFENIFKNQISDKYIRVLERLMYSNSYSMHDFDDMVDILVSNRL